MNNLQTIFEEYIAFCQYQKRLDQKTLNAYKTDLKQFSQQLHSISVENVTPDMLENYISHLHQNYKPKTAKRKIASLKAFFHHLEYRDIIDRNPFSKIQIKFREPVILPKTIPLRTVETFLAIIYRQRNCAKTAYQRRRAILDIAVIELLFATGIRISELCSLNVNDVNLQDGTILIYGKGSKERCMHIGNDKVLTVLSEYKQEYSSEIQNCKHFFVNQSGRFLSDQTIRRMINKYSNLASIELHITPHMFRHSFATLLLEQDVDIRYIQRMLGHSSISTTEIYTHVSNAKQKEILVQKHPRNWMEVKEG